MDRIHRASIKLIREYGMRISGGRVLDLLMENGASVDSGGIVRIPEELINKALASVPKELTIYDRNGRPHMTLGRENRIYFGTHADQLEILDPFTGEARPFLKADTRTMCTLADYLPNMDFVLSVGLSSDVQPRRGSVTTFVETVKNFTKPINFSTNDVDSLKEIIEIASIVAGGPDNLRRRPFIFNYCEPIPPLTHPFESTEKLYISAVNGIPVIYMPYCMMGGTSPINFATTLVQCNAEILTGLVITQLAGEGAPFIYGAMPSILDMKTTIGSYAAPEFHLLVAGASEMADYYELPFFGTAACSDSKTVDVQPCCEISYQLLSTMLSKANIVHDIGVMDHCNSVSPAMVVIADELIESLKNYVRGIRADEEDIRLDLITGAGHGGNHLLEDHTLGNFMNIWYPEIFSRKMKNPNKSQILEIVQEKIRHIVENHKVPELDANILDRLSGFLLERTDTAGASQKDRGENICTSAET
ncbi:MAG: trimethylamine methyltransferase family protein [Oligoflexales bacterium]|nr:trimethylamine methyltransferase family protein [Oligoflexales bacterium]